MDYIRNSLYAQDTTVNENSEGFYILVHAVQFGNNWISKIPLTTKLDEAVRPIQLFPNWIACCPIICVNYIVHEVHCMFRCLIINS